MKCRSCGTTIADKAIVCFKCGMATSEVQAEASRGGTRPRIWAMLAAIAGIVVLGAWLIPQTPEGTWVRWLAWAAVPVVTFATVRLIRGPRSGKLLRR